MKRGWEAGRLGGWEVLIAALLVCLPARARAQSDDAGAAAASASASTVDAGADTDAAPAPPKKKKHVVSTKDKDKADKVTTDKYEKTQEKLEGGTHWRIKTEHGAVHVWVPGNYKRATAGTIVYVHGYYVDVDQAWKDYDLAKQFRASKQNALFIVPEAPSGNDQDVFWPQLKDLRKAVSKANIRIPDGPTIVIGHSGAYRTLSQWTDHHLVAEVILLDALYGKQASFDDFIGTGKRAKYHKMILIGEDTGASSKEFAKKYPFAITRDKLPDKTTGFTKREKKAKLLYVHSQYGHMEIVTSGKVIPLLLRLTPLGAL